MGVDQAMGMVRPAVAGLVAARAVTMSPAGRNDVCKLAIFAASGKQQERMG